MPLNSVDKDDDDLLYTDAIVAVEESEEEDREEEERGRRGDRGGVWAWEAREDCQLKIYLLLCGNLFACYFLCLGDNNKDYL